MHEPEVAQPPVDGPRHWRRGRLREVEDAGNNSPRRFDETMRVWTGLCKVKIHKQLGFAASPPFANFLYKCLATLFRRVLQFTVRSFPRPFRKPLLCRSSPSN